jgi:hypothetical protein
LPALLHVLIVVLAIVAAWLWVNGEFGVALAGVAVGLAVLIVVAAAREYAVRVTAGRTPASDLWRVRAAISRRGGHPAEAAAEYARARDATGIRRVALDATGDAGAADALSQAAAAYFGLTTTITTARRHGVVPSSLLDRAGESADAAAAQLWRSCDRLAVVGGGTSPRIEAAMRAYEGAVNGLRTELDGARDGIVQVAVGSVLEAPLAEITARLARLDHASREVDRAMADAFG